ncbi:hypothetical protein J437_LFUL018309 [Ladona fulva]|uniref:C-type lectin domain-containing protein n=1 Tax=Ladona fulva TaxID=123851 RepID=A0A8K0KMV4_LADFU|nr:hypothetical protein J437_LFUL018309 [Ladona fulva]
MGSLRSSVEEGFKRLESNFNDEIRNLNSSVERRMTSLMEEINKWWSSVETKLASQEDEIKRLRLNLENQTQFNIITKNGYQLLPGLGYYKYFETHESFETARRICEKEKTHLAILNSAEEADALAHLAGKLAEDSYERLSMRLDIRSGRMATQMQLSRRPVCFMPQNPVKLLFTNALMCLFIFAPSAAL